jgi:hypothetical protein
MKLVSWTKRHKREEEDAVPYKMTQFIYIPVVLSLAAADS